MPQSVGSRIRRNQRLNRTESTSPGAIQHGHAPPSCHLWGVGLLPPECYVSSCALSLWAGPC